MAVYLGSTGYIELKRDSGSPLETMLDPADVNTTKKRFSVDFSQGSIITGDQITIATVDGTTLELVNGHSHPDGRWYVNIDDMGGMKLYASFAPSLAGETSNAVALTTPSASKAITIRTSNTRFKPLAKVKEFDFTTTRENIDTTQLGQEFREKYEKGMISGQGSVSCIWQHRNFQGDTDNFDSPEFPVYLSQLLIRMQQGADFLGKFFIYHDPAATKNSVWYDCECIVSNVAINVPAIGIVDTSIQFLTSGPIVLHNGQPPSFLLQEDSDKILQEDGSGILLQDLSS